MAGSTQARDCGGIPGTGCVGVDSGTAIRCECQPGLHLAQTVWRGTGHGCAAACTCGGDAGSVGRDVSGGYSRPDRDRATARLPRPDWAILASLFTTARLNDVDPLTWLTDVLERIVSGRTKNHQLHELLPWEWKAARAAQDMKAAA